MDLNISVKNIYIILLSPAYTNITFYGSSHNSHEILTNCLINVDNYVQRQSALLNISNIQVYLYTINLYEVGVVELLLCFWGGLTPLKFGKLWYRYIWCMFYFLMFVCFRVWCAGVTLLPVRTVALVGSRGRLSPASVPAAGRASTVTSRVSAVRSPPSSKVTITTL